jgi:putative Holliday junction resolvase
MSRILGVDFGPKRVGLAISDPGRRIASPLAVYERRDRRQDAKHFRELVAAEKVGLIVIGLPVRARGEEGQKAKEARAFGAWLGEVTRLPVEFSDEAFTTVEAESHLWQAGLTHKQRRQRRDMLAAQILLQGYLEAKQTSHAAPAEAQVKKTSHAEHAEAQRKKNTNQE